MRSVFAQLLERLDRRVMARLVAAHDGDRGVLDSCRRRPGCTYPLLELLNRGYRPAPV
jgi:hypothetical protein